MYARQSGDDFHDILPKKSTNAPQGRLVALNMGVEQCRNDAVVLQSDFINAQQCCLQGILNRVLVKYVSLDKSLFQGSTYHLPQMTFVIFVNKFGRPSPQVLYQANHLSGFCER